MFAFFSLLFLLYGNEKPSILVLPFINASSATNFQSKNQGKETALSHILAEKLSAKLKPSIGRRLEFLDRNHDNPTKNKLKTPLNINDAFNLHLNFAKSLEADFLITGTITEYTIEKKTITAYNTHREVQVHQISIVYNFVNVQNSTIVYSGTTNALAHNSQSKCIGKAVAQISGDIFDWVNSHQGTQALFSRSDRSKHDKPKY